MKTVIRSVSAVWRKAEREAYRAFHAKSKEHKADHFFNFCVTAHSLRDYFLEHRRLPDPVSVSDYHALWNGESQLVAVAEIANLSKHFQLRDRGTRKPRIPKTRHLVHKLSEVVDVYVSPGGEFSTIPRSARDISITTSGGTRYDLWEFQIDVLDYWREFLRGNGFRVYRQPLEQMLDHFTDR